MFNGPLYIPVVSLTLLTEGRTARNLPKQRGAKKKAQLVTHRVRVSPSEFLTVTELPKTRTMLVRFVQDRHVSRIRSKLEVLAELIGDDNHRISGLHIGARHIPNDRQEPTCLPHIGRKVPLVSSLQSCSFAKSDSNRKARFRYSSLHRASTCLVSRVL